MTKRKAQKNPPKGTSNPGADATPPIASPKATSDRPDPLRDAETVASRELPPDPARRKRGGQTKAELRKAKAEADEAFRKESDIVAGELRELLLPMIGIRKDEPVDEGDGLLYAYEANLLCRHGARVLVRRGGGALAEYGDEIIVATVAIGVLVRSIRGWWDEAKAKEEGPKANAAVGDNGSTVRGATAQAVAG